ncbi:MAG TPA: hypothetical protein VMB34_03930 [Acetobacteraceae bacterium]|nr:hypothetical protein [Acetobacteraceae bacterium]
MIRPHTAPPRGSSEPRSRCLLPALLLAGLASAIGTIAMAQTPDVTKRILVLPALQWNDTASTWHYAVLPDAGQITSLLGGLQFGMSPEQVGQHLPDRNGALHWDDLPDAKEFSQDVRYVWLPMQAVNTLLGPVKSCFGRQSYLVVLLFDKALFRVSWRFMPDATCPNPRAASEELYSAFLPLAPSVAISARYTAGYAEVVDVTAPDAGALIPVHWQMQGQ